MFAAKLREYAAKPASCSPQTSGKFERTLANSRGFAANPRRTGEQVRQLANNFANWQTFTANKCSPKFVENIVCGEQCSPVGRQKFAAADIVRGEHRRTMFAAKYVRRRRTFVRQLANIVRRDQRVRVGLGLGSALRLV